MLLDRLVLEEEYVAVLFLGECEGEEKVRDTCLLSSLAIAILHFLFKILNTGDAKPRDVCG